MALRLLLPLLLAHLLPCGARRSLQVRMNPVDDRCDNTRDGRSYLADSNGFVCGRMEMNYQTGCCSGGVQNSCHTCLTRDQCCSSYEHCVSCCLSADKKAASLYKDVFRVAGQNNTGHWSSPFEFCAGRCRPSINSTAHENAFISPRHYCFSDTGRPKTIEHPPAIPDGVQVLAGQRGKDCAATCQEQGLVCDGAALAAVNHCDALRSQFKCEAGCNEVKGHADAPSYVIYGSAKSLSPSLCSTAAKSEPLSCTAAAAHVRRICTCTAGAGAAAAIPSTAGI